MSWMDFVAACPICQVRMQPDSASGEEFHCPACKAMLDVLDDELCMLSLPPHDEVCFIPSADLLWMAPAFVH